MQVLGTAGKVVLGVGMAVILWAAFLYAHPAENFVGESSRIVFFHVPTAWISALAFLLAAIHSALYLKTRKIEQDDAAASAARLGILFCVLATITGSNVPLRSRGTSMSTAPALSVSTVFVRVPFRLFPDSRPAASCLG